MKFTYKWIILPDPYFFEIHPKFSNYQFHVQKNNEDQGVFDIVYNKHDRKYQYSRYNFETLEVEAGDRIRIYIELTEDSGKALIDALKARNINFIGQMEIRDVLKDILAENMDEAYHAGKLDGFDEGYETAKWKYQE